MEKTEEWLWQCSIPDNAELQEHILKTESTVIIGEKCRIDYGLDGSEIIVSEFCQINGNIHAEDDLRIDNWTVVTGDVTSDGNAYLGEGVKINGRLLVAGDLDLGDNVAISGGFEAKGWISIRNPMPVIAYIMLYLVTLLGIEKEEDINAMFQKLFSEPVLVVERALDIAYTNARNTLMKDLAAAKKKKPAAAAAAAKKKVAPKKRSKQVEEEVVEEAPAPAAKRARKGKGKDSNDKYIWEYKERDRWFPYAKDASDIVEAAYQEYLNDPNQIDVRSVQSGMWSYQVDFTNMTQTNIQHENHTVRDIRRTLVSSE